jgi:hypothetical protein
MSVVKLKKQQPKNLNDLISNLPTPDLSNSDIRELLLQFIQEIPNDDPAGVYAAKSKVKLDAFNLLIKLNQMEAKTAGTADLITLIDEEELENDE